MIYLYIDENGDVGKSEDEPTKVNLEAVADGHGHIVRLSIDKFGNILPELSDPSMDCDDTWYDVPSTVIEEPGDDDDFELYHSTSN